MPKTLRRLKISEVSSVDAGAGRGTRVVLAKRAGPTLFEAAAEQRRDRMVAIGDVSKALAIVVRKANDSGYGAMLAVAKQLRRPGESDAAAFVAAYAAPNPRVPGGHRLMSAHLAAKRYGAGGPMEYGGGDATPARRPLDKFGGGRAKFRFSPQAGDESAADFEPDVTVSDEAGTGDTPYPDSGGGYDALSEWNASVTRIQRQMKLPTRSAAVDVAMKDSGARSHWERAKAHRQVPG
jgi:hypothetical protein